ncbi:Sec-independent protein translocase protein TatB [Brevundimonas sp.]|uniref:Sec-independent protein translocase protein TatB n=1 Tax=Brevundimonas sp. TaxID=1871086 RepID=UPI002BCC7E7C|nr:Sec-independent protein translocase protein TatB [Brevundimonas sp.]HWQ86092.1 Sec-independent protein translocase protein TatB [Brevundimonas sp.]
MGPGIGGGEYLVIAVVALLVVGPERLPLLLRKLGKLVARARGMANEFRSSFDEMARQSELDELRKEVEALRTNQGIHALGADADAAFREIRDDLNKPLDPPMLSAPDEWPDSPPVMTPLDTPVAAVAPAPKPARKTPAKVRPATGSAASIKTASGKARPVRARKVDL